MTPGTRACPRAARAAARPRGRGNGFGAAGTIPARALEILQQKDREGGFERQKYPGQVDRIQVGGIQDAAEKVIETTAALGLEFGLRENADVTGEINLRIAVNQSGA